MTTLFTSDLLTCTNVSHQTISGIDISHDETKTISFLVKVGDPLVIVYPKIVEYSFNTKELNVTFELAQISMGAQFQVSILQN